MGFLLSSLASELKAADKLKERWGGAKSQAGSINPRRHQVRKAHVWWVSGERVPEDGNLPIIVASCQELPTG